jgi:hypothetical protein
MSENPQDLTHMGVAAALAENFRRDTQTFLPLLAAALHGALPTHTTVERKGGIFQREKPVHKVTVCFEEDTYAIEKHPQFGLVANHVKTVRNIVIKREQLAVAQWLHDLCAHIAERADEHEKAFFALKNLLD